MSNLATIGLGAVAATGVGPLSFAFGQSPSSSKTGMIDVHHHYLPRFYLTENRERIAEFGNGSISPAWFSWTPAQAIEALDKNGVATGVLSLPLPGVWLGDANVARKTARRVNEYAADLVRTHKGRFGHFATLPLPDAEGSLREIEYAFDTLKADGIGVLTNYGDKWLGDASYSPVFEELNRRKAVVFVHPTLSRCCQNLMPDVGPLVAEITQDTTRAVANLLFTGTLSRFKDIRFIFSHAGGNVAMVYGRMLQYGPKNIAKKAPNGVEYELKRLYYDIAGTAFRPAIAALTSLVPTTQILLGSDNPYVPLGETVQGMAQLGLPAADLRAIGRDNALALMPWLRTATT